MRTRTLILAVVCLALVAAGAAAKTTKTVQVDCDKGGSLGAALEEKADQLVIEFSGTCAEDVLVSRRSVTLRGIGDAPAVTGADTADPQRHAIEVNGVSDVVLRGFTVRGSKNDGVRVGGGGSALLQDLVVEDSVSDGLDVRESSSVVVADCVFRGNGRRGALVSGGSSMGMTGRLEISANRGGLVIGASSGASGSGSLVVDGNFPSVGIGLASLGSLEIYGGSILTTNNRDGLFVAEGAFFKAFNTPVESTGNDIGVIGGRGGKFQAGDLEVTGNHHGIWALGASLVEIWGDSSVSANQDFGILLDGSTLAISGTVVRDNGGPDVWALFGSRLDSEGNDFGSVYCDETVISRGDSGCPAAPGSGASLVESEMRQVRPLPERPRDLP